MYRLQSLPSALVLLIATSFALPADEPITELGINVVTPVSCSRPTQKGDKISVNYAGRLLSTGEEFDNSFSRGRPFSFRLGYGAVIKGWDQGLLDMCPGEARELTIPAELGYGSRGTGPIPPGAVLVFDTELVEIVGVTQESVSTLSTAASTAVETLSTPLTGTATEAVFGIATAPASPTDNELLQTPAPTFVSEDRLPNTNTSPTEKGDKSKSECQLLGPFALIVQGALGVMALLALVFKRFRETPKRPWKIWFFDVSKQVMGSMLLHVLNLFMSMLGAGDLAASAVVAAAEKAADAQGNGPNPCSFYILNLGIDVSRPPHNFHHHKRKLTNPTHRQP
jgi:hypothetical protein